MAARFYPDGLTIEIITALQREVDAELRQEGYATPLTPRPPSGDVVVDADLPNQHRHNHRSARRTANSAANTAA